MRIDLSAYMSALPSLLFMLTTKFATGLRGKVLSRKGRDGERGPGAGGATSNPVGLDGTLVGGVGQVTGRSSGGPTGAAIISCEPSGVARGRTLYVEIAGRGTAFKNGECLPDFGPGVRVNSVFVLSGTMIKVGITVLADAPPGPREVCVVSGPGSPTPLPGGFTVEREVPHIESITPARGPQGAPVIISGKNFGFARGASTVEFGSRKARSYARWSDTEIRVRVPAGLWGSAPVRVMTSSGASNRKAFAATRETEPRETTQRPTWYFEKEIAAWGFSTYLTIMNPNQEDVTAEVTFIPNGRSAVVERIPLPAMSQTTLTDRYIKSLLGNEDFSAKVECLEGQIIGVDRTVR